MKRCFFIFFLVCAVSMLYAFSAQAGRMTRDLVFDDDGAMPKPAPDGKSQAVVAVKTTIELIRDGKTMYIAPESNFEFKAGDKVRIFYSTNVDCYVYWMSRGTSGQYYMLFPNSKTGTNNLVTKNQENIIPFTGSFVFDATPGTERILLTMSPEKIPELEQAAQMAMVKGGRFEANQEKVAIVLAKNESQRKTRDLVYDEETNAATGVETIRQTGVDIKQPFVHNYELKHK